MVGPGKEFALHDGHPPRIARAKRRVETGRAVGYTYGADRISDHSGGRESVRPPATAGPFRDRRDPCRPGAPSASSHLPADPPRVATGRRPRPDEFWRSRPMPGQAGPPAAAVGDRFRACGPAVPEGWQQRCRAASCRDGTACVGWVHSARAAAAANSESAPSRQRKDGMEKEAGAGTPVTRFRRARGAYRWNGGRFARPGRTPGARHDAGRWPLAAGRWPLAAGRWPLAAGRWPLAYLYAREAMSSSDSDSRAPPHDQQSRSARRQRRPRRTVPKSPNTCATGSGSASVASSSTLHSRWCRSYRKNVRTIPLITYPCEETVRIGQRSRGVFGLSRKCVLAVYANSTCPPRE